MMKLLIVTDAFEPQLNGVVRTLKTTIGILEQQGWDVRIIHPMLFKTIPTPRYAEIPMVVSTKGLSQMMRDFDPDYVHIATEGRLGWSARSLCRKWGWQFTTAYHTDFPRYLRKYFGLPEAITYHVLRKFHDASAAIMVATPTVEQQLRERGFDRIKRWGRGVNTSIFKPRTTSSQNTEPVLLNVGRVSKEKNIEAFLDLDIKGTKIVVGNGPMLERYRSKYPDVIFKGEQTGIQLADTYAAADVFVFPSVTDTFGLVIIEALACGTPVAAFPVQGPIDILCHDSGRMDKNLTIAIGEALTLDRSKVANIGQGFTWENATRQFVAALVPRLSR